MILHYWKPNQKVELLPAKVWKRYVPCHEDWDKVANSFAGERKAEVRRTTKETDFRISKSGW